MFTAKILLGLLIFLSVTAFALWVLAVYKFSQARMLLKAPRMVTTDIPEYLTRLKRDARIGAGAAVGAILLCILILFVYREPINRDLERLFAGAVLVPPVTNRPIAPEVLEMRSIYQELIAEKDKLIANHEQAIAWLKQQVEKTHAEKLVASVRTAPPRSEVVADKTHRRVTAVPHSNREFTLTVLNNRLATMARQAGMVK